MKKIIFNIMPMAFVMLASLSACSSDDMQGDENNKGKCELNIRLSENGFGGNEATRYIKADTYVVDSQQVDLGNGLVADLVVTKDPAETNEYGTRAAYTYQTAEAADYTVKAVSSSNVISTFTGHWDGSTFTRTGTWELAAGTYDMFCFQSDGFSTHPLLPKRIIMSTAPAYMTNNHRAVLSERVSKTIIAGRNDVDFKMDHRTSGIRIKFNSTTSSFKDLAAQYDYYNASDYFEIPSLEYKLNRTTSGDYSTLKLRMDPNEVNTSEYDYFVPQTKAEELTLHFTGGSLVTSGVATPLNGISFKLQNFTTEQSHRYTVNVTINAKNVAAHEYVTTIQTGANGSYIKASENTATITLTNNNTPSVTAKGNVTGKVSVIPSPSTGYFFEKWTGIDTEPIDMPLVFSVKDNDGKTITANFLKKYEKGANEIILRARPNTNIILTENSRERIIFVPNYADSYFKREDVSNGESSKIETPPADNPYTVSYDSHTGIYTIKISNINDTQCATLVTLCTNFDYMPAMIEKCPLTCDYEKIDNIWK